jgi:hypothetical protein
MISFHLQKLPGDKSSVIGQTTITPIFQIAYPDIQISQLSDRKKGRNMSSEVFLSSIPVYSG